MRKIMLIFFIVVGSSFVTVVASQMKERSWYQRFRIANYLPNFMGSRITQWRVKRMFEGTEKFIQRLAKESKAWKEKDAIAFLKEYANWIDGFYDIINETYPVKLSAGVPARPIGLFDLVMLRIDRLERSGQLSEGSFMAHDVCMQMFNIIASVGASSAYLDSLTY